MNLTLLRFAGWIALGVMTSALPVLSAVLFRWNPRPRYVQRFYIWLAVALDCVAVGGALADARELGWLRISSNTLGWASILLGVMALLTLALALWYLLAGVEREPEPRAPWRLGRRLLPPTA